ncbi:unnamed protein product [Rotaria sp. Silwood2]|nr:unnamed protein product [Rotaria sp. Silwood2]CAF4623217.1 unnamed protein product [Rotaria sp. Silwood2]
MPTTDPEPRRNETKPHQHIYVIALRAPIREENLMACSPTLESVKSHPSFIQMTKTNSEGVYEFNLPTGIDVTIVAWINNKPYLNSYNGMGSWSFIKVPDSGYITFDIYDSIDAVC